MGCLKHLFIGGSKNAKDKKLLKELNIKYILNCTPKRSVDPEAGCPNYYEKEKLFVYKRIPIFDNKGEDIMAHMATAYRFIEEGKHYGNILVHCRKGVSRSASYVIGYLMAKNELTCKEAFDFVKALRPIVQPNSSFETQLQAFDTSTLTNTTNFSSSSSKYASVGPSTASMVEIAGPSLPPPRLIISEEVEQPPISEEEEQPPSKKVKST